MKSAYRWLLVGTAVTGLCSAVAVFPCAGQQPTEWLAHDLQRPTPPIVKSGPLKLPVAPPSDAIVLFDGSNLDAFRSEDGSAARWRIEDGAMISVADAGYVYTKQGFGDVQLHLEWAAPLPAEGTGQDRGNSGVFLMSRYEVQILDCYQNETYADGYAAAIYGQYPPLVNACLPPGQWQSYDIVFRRPRFNRDGTLEARARITVIHNGIVVQDNVALWGGTNWLQAIPYQPHPERLPLALQDHGNPVRFRNIWVRELSEWTPEGPPPTPLADVLLLTPAQLAPYAGQYRFDSGYEVELVVNGEVLQAHFNERMAIDLVPRSRTRFDLRWTAAHVDFDVAADGQVTGLTFHIGGEHRVASRVSAATTEVPAE